MKWYIARTNALVGCRNKDIYILAIPLDQAIVTKSGSDLIMELPDGKKITFQSFYRKDVSFMVDDRILTPQDFFASIKAVDVLPDERWEDGVYIVDDRCYEEFLSSCTFSPEDEARLEEFLSSPPDEPDPDFFNHQDDCDPFDQPDDPPFI